MVAIGVEDNWFERWVRGHPVTAIIIASTLVAIVLTVATAAIVSSRSAALDANSRAVAAGVKADRLAHELCQDVNRRVAQRRQSDRASAAAWAGIAQQLRVALAEVPPARRGSAEVVRTWRIWSDAHHAALQLRDRGILRTVTRC